ncbi:tetratricopeptide repeat protein [Mycobacterium sp. NPDC003323]
MSDDIAAQGSHALALYGQGRVQESLAAAWQTAAAHPKSPLAQYTYASLLREAGRDAEALVVVDAALRLYPGSADAWVLRGDLRQKSAGPAAAESDYLAALRIDADHPLATHNLAVGRLRWGTNTEALRGLLDAVRLDPGLRALAVGNIASALARVLRAATASTVLLAVALIALTALHDQSQSTALARVFAVVLTVPSVAALVWVLRMVPGPTLRAVLATRLVPALRLVFLMAAVSIGLLAAALGSTMLTTVAPALLLFGVVVLTVLGWVFGG